MLPRLLAAVRRDDRPCDRHDHDAAFRSYLLQHLNLRLRFSQNLTLNGIQYSLVALMDDRPVSGHPLELNNELLSLPFVEDIFVLKLLSVTESQPSHLVSNAALAAAFFAEVPGSVHRTGAPKGGCDSIIGCGMNDVKNGMAFIWRGGGIEASGGAWRRLLQPVSFEVLILEFDELRGKHIRERGRLARKVNRPAFPRHILASN